MDAGNCIKNANQIIMAKFTKQELEPIQPKYDLRIPEVRRDLRVLEAELNNYEGPWKLEQYALARNLIQRDIYFKIRDMTLTDGTVVPKPEYSAVRSGFGDLLDKYKALRKLQEMTKYAKSEAELSQAQISEFI
jgi:hypothetical protein